MRLQEPKMSGTNVAVDSARIDVDGLYRRYGPMVLRRCRSLLKNEELAEDAMQETFVQVLRHQATLNARYPSSLLYRIATNVSLNALRSRRRRPAVSAELLSGVLAGSDNVEERQLDSLMLEEVFAGAREGTRRAAEIHFLEEKTLAETAQEVGMSVSGIRKRFRALRENGSALMTR
jgi:RNA polymerase sigma-70 factor, ECF subfamily